MRILEGPHAADGWKLHQWANDWMTAVPPGGGHPVIVKPGCVELTPAEAEWMRADRQAWKQGQRRHGLFWAHWQLGDDGRFTRTEPGRGYHATQARHGRRRGAARGDPEGNA